MLLDLYLLLQMTLICYAHPLFRQKISKLFSLSLYKGSIEVSESQPVSEAGERMGFDPYPVGVSRA